MAKAKKNTKSQNKEVALDFTELQRMAWAEFEDYLDRLSSLRPRKHTREQIRRYVNDPNKYEQQLREVSLYLYVASPHYMRLINYFYSMLTLDYVVIPYSLDKERLNYDRFIKSYKNVVDYIEAYNIKHTFSKVLFSLLLTGVYYGYERWVKDSFVLQNLPTEYCKITGIEDGIFTFSMDMRYFDKNKIDPNDFGDEINSLYDKYKSTKEPWQQINAENGVCFTFFPNLPWQVPPFAGIYEDIMDIDDFKDLYKSKQKIDNFKLIQQKIPFKDKPTSERDFLISLDSVKVFHNNIKKVLPDGVGLVSSPMELKEINFEQKKDFIYESTVKAQENLFDAAGISKGLFNSDHNNAVSINRGINVDEAFVFPLLHQFERFFKYRLKRFNTNQYKFKLHFPPITVFNWKEKYDQYLKAAQYGFPKSFVAAALGYSVSDLEGLNFFENECLELVDKMIPVSSAHTSSNRERGRPRKDDNELTPSGEQTRETAANEGR